MTVSSTLNTATYSGNNSTVAFAVPFYFQQASDLVVEIVSPAGAVLQTLVYNTDFTLSNATDPNFGWPTGATLTTTTAPINGTNIYISRQVAPLQPLSIPTSGPFPSAPIERELDRLSMSVNDTATTSSQASQAATSAAAAAASATASATSATASAASATAAAQSAASVGNQWCGTSTGTANALILTPPTTVPAYQAGLQFQFISGTTNTGATTLKVGSLAAKTVLDQAGSALIAGSIVTGLTYSVIYNGTNFVINELATLPANSVNTTQLVNGAITSIKTNFTAPTQTIITAGSSSYNTPSGVKWIKVRMAGGGGGGGGATSGGAGSAGGTTSFGTSLLSANGGGGGGSGGIGTAIQGGIGGNSFAVNSPAFGFGLYGSNGHSGSSEVSAGYYLNGGGSGGNTPFFNGGGQGNGYNQSGAGAQNYSGGGGQGGSDSNSGNKTFGAGGGSGAYVEATIYSPSSSYSYSVGTGGNGGGNGGNGAAGIIIIDEYYQ